MTEPSFSVYRPLSRLLCCLIAALFVSACVYRIPIQQGNFLEAKEINQVTVGMTRAQVRYLLGTPMVADPFSDARWDYIYYLKKSRIHQPEERHLIVFFDQDKVVRIEQPKPV